jgi:hypothetical protein
VLSVLGDCAATYPDEGLEIIEQAARIQLRLRSQRDWPDLTFSSFFGP